MLSVFGLLALLPPHDAGDSRWQLALAALVVALAVLVLVQLYVRGATITVAGEHLVYRWPAWRSRRIDRAGLDAVVGLSVRLWATAPPLRIVVFRAGARPVLRLAAVCWDLDELDDLADELRLPVRNETAVLIRREQAARLARARPAI